MSSLSFEYYQQEFSRHVQRLQEEVCLEVGRLDENLDLCEDLWERKDFEGNPGGGGRTRALKGDFLENGGVNTSEIFGKVDPSFAKSLGVKDNNLWASGISLILHPRNPRVPTVHANFRFIVAGEKFWFGGGADLTPFYPYEEDFKEFHQVWKNACKPYSCYQQMKETCDSYFTNHHRDGEMRGVGGIFFDHFNTGDLKKDFEMVLDLSRSFIPSYFPLAHKRKNESWTNEDEDFQLYRRGRYVEFNLLHDRGTAFGLKSNGRTESILISLPARAKFAYNYAPPAGSIHEKMMKYYRPFSW